MPFPIKLGLTITVALVALAGWFYMGHIGRTGPQWAVAFLGPFTVIALWVFPEVTRRPVIASEAKQSRGRGTEAGLLRR